MERSKKKLDWSHSMPRVPEPIPTDTRDLLDLMDEAANYAGSAQGVTAPAFDHGMRIFNQLNAHYLIHVAKETAEAHAGLTRATQALKFATWWLAVVTVTLGRVELFKLFQGH
jgi:hypothetical protein